jgi:hypothetical protein
MQSMDAGIEIFRQDSAETLNDKPDERHRALIDSVMLSMSSENNLIACARYVMPLATGLFFLLNLCVRVTHCDISPSKWSDQGMFVASEFLSLSWQARQTKLLKLDLEVPDLEGPQALEGTRVSTSESRIPQEEHTQGSSLQEETLPIRTGPPLVVSQAFLEAQGQRLGSVLVFSSCLLPAQKDTLSDFPSKLPQSRWPQHVRSVAEPIPCEDGIMLPPLPSSQVRVLLLQAMILFILAYFQQLILRSLLRVCIVTCIPLNFRVS